MLKLFVFLITFYILHSTFYIPAGAVCPVCTVAIGGGLLLSHYLGVDDLISGVWVGGFILAFGLWMATYIKKTFFKGQEWLIIAFLWVTTVFGLKEAGLIGNPTCKIHGHDKLLSGIVFGTVAFILGYGLDLVLRRLNKKEPGKVLFPYQKVILPVVFLILATIFSAQLCSFGIK